MTTEKPEPTDEVKHEHVLEALKLLDFEDVMDLQVKPHKGTIKIAVDLTGGKKSVFFRDGSSVIMQDDEAGTLAQIGKVIIDAEKGIMPEPPRQEKPKEQTKPVPSQTKEQAKEEPGESTTDEAAKTTESVDKAPAKTKSILELIEQYVGNDVLQIFGDTGAGKSKFCLETARQALAAGKKVYYLDTERNLTGDDVASLSGCQYRYTPVLDEIDDIVQHLPAVDVVILDSIGFPVLTTYARLSLKQKGDALLKLIAIFGDLKTWAYKNNGVAIVTNQPESEFNKEKGHIFRPFGDKSQFACKEIWKTKIATRSANETNVIVNAFRSRSVGFGTKITMLKITSNGVEVEK